MRKHLLIGAATSGSGKTTFTVGLLGALAKRGTRVQPFKCGPDYIDPQFHAQAAGRASVNLDPWLASDTHLRQVYQKWGANADVAITEGVMGLFDGYDRWTGSSAHRACLLDIPVILLVNARSTAYSVAPLIYGFRHFQPRLRVAGVVFNQVGSESHFRHLSEACADAGARCFGYLPRMTGLEVPSRHLGLTLDQRFSREQWIERVAQVVESHIDLDALLEAGTINNKEEAIPAPPPPTGHLRIAVARDEAFNFTYPENIAQLERLGQVVYFSPLKDTALPEGSDLLYLPGGYPEFFLPTLAGNQSSREAIARFARQGGKVLAECGGMMYLCQEIIDEGGTRYPMCGVLPLTASMEGMRLRLGYRQFQYQGETWKGHEFHYSKIVGDLPSATTLYDAQGRATGTPLYRQGNVIAGYTHLYWGEQDLLKLWKS